MYLSARNDDVAKAVYTLCLKCQYLVLL